jgi:hypothetical protein
MTVIVKQADRRIYLTFLKLTDFYGVSIDYLFLNYKLPLEKPLKTNSVEQRLLKVFRKMNSDAQLSCLQFLNKLLAQNKK